MWWSACGAVFLRGEAFVGAQFASGALRRRAISARWQAGAELAGIVGIETVPPDWLPRTCGRAQRLLGAL